MLLVLSLLVGCPHGGAPSAQTVVTQTGIALADCTLKELPAAALDSLPAIESIIETGGSLEEAQLHAEEQVLLSAGITDALCVVREAIARVEAKMLVGKTVGKRTMDGITRAKGWVNAEAQHERH